jgi:ABC-type sugar transport system substrate-binding protein
MDLTIRRQRRRLLWPCLALAGLAAVGGCSTSSSSTGNGASTANQATAGAGLAAAKAEVTTMSALPTSVGITEPITPTVAGKTVIYLECGIVNCKIHTDALTNAFQALHVKLKVLESGLTPESFKNALATAQSLHPDGVIYDAIPAAIAQGPADAMASEGIPVVAIAAPDLKESAHVVNEMGTSFFIRDGETIADWTIADSGGHADTLYISDPTLSFGPWLTQGLMGAFAKNCPGCSVSELTTNPSEIGSTLPNKIVSYLQAHPGVKYIDAEYSALLTGLPAALSTAGISGIKTIGTGPTQIDQQYMQAGQETAGLFASQGAMAYWAADTIARLMTGEQPLPVVNNPPNLQLLTASQITWNPGKTDYPYIPGWQHLFTKAWGAAN